jgi:hypothetical protein
MRYVTLFSFGLLLVGPLHAQNSCFAWYDVDTVPSLFGRWLWRGWTQPEVYYVRPGGDYIWIGGDTLLNWAWWGSCGQGSTSSPSRRVPIFINLSAGDSCRLQAAAWGQVWGRPCGDSLSLLVIAHPGAWGHCYGSFSLAGQALPPGATYTLQHAAHYTATFTAHSEWPYTSTYQVRWRLSGPVRIDTTFLTQSLSSPTTLSLPLTQPGVYTLTIGYFIYEQASNGCEDSLRYTIYVLQDSTGWGCPTNFPDTLRLTLGSHRLTFPLGYSTALYMWSLQGPSGYQSGSNGNVDTIIVPAVFSSPGWHILQLLFYSPNGYHCQVHIMIYVSPPTVPPCLSPTVRPCKPLVTINNVTLSPNGGPYQLCSGRSYVLCVSPSGGYCHGRSYSWGYTLYSTGVYVGGPFYSSCDTLRTPANAFSSAFMTVWMTVRDSAGNVVCRDSSFYVLDITPLYCGYPDSVNVGLGDSTYWPGDTISYTPPDTILGYVVPTPISDTLLYTWQWSISPVGGGPSVLSGISNIIPISVSPGTYILQITSTSQGHQRTRQYQFYIAARTSTLSSGGSSKPLLYPNPSLGTFWIGLSEGGPYRLEVVDALGRQVLRGELTEVRTYEFSLPAGFYVVRLVGSSQQHMYRLVVQP